MGIHLAPAGPPSASSGAHPGSRRGGFGRRIDEADAEANLRTVTVHRAPYTPATYTFTIDSRYQRLSRTGPESLDEHWTYDARGDVETSDILGDARLAGRLW